MSGMTVFVLSLVVLGLVIQNFRLWRKGNK